MGNANGARSQKDEQEAAAAQEAYHPVESGRQRPLAQQPEPRDTLPIDEAAAWRRPGVQHSLEQIWLDVADELEVQLSSAGTVLSTQLRGRITVNCELSGMPHCTLGLSWDGASPDTPFPPIDVDGFHECVDQDRFRTERNVRFVPPDGRFELLRFRPSQPPSSPRVCQPPLVLVDVSVVSSTALRVVYAISARLQRSEGLAARDITIRIPVPTGLHSAMYKQPLFQSLGSCVTFEQHEITWTIVKMKQHKRCTVAFDCDAGAESADGAEGELQAITTEFSFGGIAYATPFPLQDVFVDYLQVTGKHGDAAVPWCRYLTRITCRQPHPLTAAWLV